MEQVSLAHGFAMGLMFCLVSVLPNYMFLSGKDRRLLVFHLFTCFTLFWFQFVDFSALIHILVLNILCLNMTSNAPLHSAFSSRVLVVFKYDGLQMLRFASHSCSVFVLCLNIDGL